MQTKKSEKNITAGFSTFNIIEWQKHKIEIYKRKAKKKKRQNDGKTGVYGIVCFMVFRLG